MSKQERFYKGVDLSTLREVVNDGGKFYDNGIEDDALSILCKYGINAVRIRVWHNPYDAEGNPYMGGTCDMDNLLWLAKQVKQRGLDILLCIHYSDFWVDPSRQCIPKEWAGCDIDRLTQLMYQYTQQVLQTMIDNNCAPTLVQVGNEITNGILWPVGKLVSGGNARGNYESLCKLLNAGCRAIRDTLPSAKIVMHLEDSCNNTIYREWMDNAVEYDLDFDILGVSYYANWHGTIDKLASNLTDMKRYGKPMMIVETAYAFTFKSHQYTLKDNNPLVVNRQLLKDEKVIFPYGVSKSGQRKFVKHLFELCQQLQLRGLFYWEAGWIPTPNSSWSSAGARQYMGEEDKKGGNEWCNQCLFDYEGNALPALQEFDKDIK